MANFIPKTKIRMKASKSCNIRLSRSDKDQTKVIKGRIYECGVEQYKFLSKNGFVEYIEPKELKKLKEEFEKSLINDDEIEIETEENEELEDISNDEDEEIEYEEDEDEEIT